jgi:hypothetical protein
MKLFLAALAATAFTTSAVAADTRVKTVVSTSQTFDPWTVCEVSEYGQGPLVCAAPSFYGTQGKNYPLITIPWSDNDGYWYATTTFSLPAGAKDPTLVIASLFADDRVALALNENVVASTGYNSPGEGEMQWDDGGDLTDYYFATAQGAKVDHITTGFQTGVNTLTLIVNNTGSGITGGVSGGGPTNVGLSASVIYRMPASAPDTSVLTKSFR